MKEKKFSGGVIFNSINVNAIDSLSGIFIGENRQWNWFSSSKTNSGLGTIQGEDNVMLNSINIVIDPDLIDNPTNFAADKLGNYTNSSKQINTNKPQDTNST